MDFERPGSSPEAAARFYGGLLGADSPRPGGVMSPYLGEQYMLAEAPSPDRPPDPIKEMFGWKELGYERPYVRAYEATALMNERFDAAQDTSIDAAIERFLRSKIPEFAWRLDLDEFFHRLAFRSHQVLHANLWAPIDAATGQPMILELFGEMIAIDDVEMPPGSPARAAWLEVRDKQMEAEKRNGRQSYIRVLGKIRFQVTQATYANVFGSRIGIREYRYPREITPALKTTSQ